jgi:hypothetical protein
MQLRAVPLALLILLSGCSVRSGEFSTALGTLLRSDAVSEVDFAKVLPLEWDELFAFGPYSIRERNCEVLNLGWLECRIKLPAEVEEGEYFFLFRRGVEVVHSEHHSRQNGDFGSHGTPTPWPIDRANARFLIHRIQGQGESGTLRFELEHIATALARLQ